MKILIKNGVMNADGLICGCPIDTEATVSAETGRALIAQGIAVAAEDEKKHKTKPEAEPADK